MSLCLEQWESLGSFLAHIASSGTAEISVNSSLDNGRGFAGTADLPTFVQQCQTLHRDDFAERADAIDRVAGSLTGDLPAGQTVRRQPVWGHSGSSVNVHKVMRGDLGHAWRRTVRRCTPQDGGEVVLILPSVVAAGIDHAQMQWSAVATLALADYARRSGRRVEVWSVGYMDRCYQSGGTYVWCVPLVRAGQSWDSSAVCLATYPEWLRRLGFRAVEMSTQRGRRLERGYGTQLPGPALLAWARATWAPARGFVPASLVLGCSQEDRVRSRAQAERWVTAQLAGLAEA